MAWIPEMCLKYPATLLDDGRELSQAAKVQLHFKFQFITSYSHFYIILTGIFEPFS